MPSPKLYEKSPRDYALELVEEGVDVHRMLLSMLLWMSHDDVREALDANELSPRFSDESDLDEADLDAEDEAWLEADQKRG